MFEAAVWGFVGATSLIVGAEVAFAFRLSRFVVGLIMAFGVGALIASVSFELIEPALATGETIRVGLGLAAGGLTFFTGDVLIARMGGRGRKRLPDETVTESASRDGDDLDEGDRDDSDTEHDEGGGSSGLGIVLGTVLDGIPESAVLGVSLVGGGAVSVPLLAGIWISNFPEAIGSTGNLADSGMRRRSLRLMWWSIALVSGVSAAIGFWAVSNSSLASGSFVSAFAAGALLTMIIDEMAPEAFERSQKYAGLATIAGFALAVWLGTFE